MINIINGIIAMFFLTAFIGGLAVSIWKNTHSVAFSLIVIGVLAAFYIDVYQTLREQLANRKKP
jgi:hypothetical protein